MAQTPRFRSEFVVPRRRHVAKPRLEELEDRCTPAINLVAGLPEWLPAGPFGVSGLTQVSVANTTNNEVTGAIEAVATHPTNPQVVFVGGVNGGIWRTGTALSPTINWQPLTDGLPSASIGSIDINPNNPNQLLAGVGGYSSGIGRSGDLIGLYYTNNALDAVPTFQVFGGPLQNQSFRSVVLRNNYMLAGSTGGIFGAGFLGNFGNAGSLFRSLDQGTTFTDLAGTGGLPGAAAINDIVADPLEPQRVYVATATQIFRTDNILAAVPTWVNITPPGLAGNPNIVRIRLAIHRSQLGEAVYVAVAETNVFGEDQLSRVSYTTDRGATFIPMNLPEGLSAPQPIVAATNTTPIGITTLGQHFLLDGDRVVVSGVNGNTAANGTFTVTVTSATTFILNGSVGNGVYTGGGTIQTIFGIHPGGQGFLHLSFEADPNDPGIVYIGGDRQDQFFPTTNSIGATTFSAILFRGDRRIAPTTSAPSPQWTPITNTNTNDTFPHADSRNFTIDAQGNLIEVDDGGIYRLGQPTRDGGSWQALNGNLSLNQFATVRYDIRNNVLFGGTQDTGSSQQVSGAGPLGSGQWENTQGGDGFWQGVDNISDPNITYRYQSANTLQTLRRFGYDTTNTQVAAARVLFADPTTPNVPYSALNFGEQNAFGRNIFAINAVDGRLLMIGPANVNSLFEDADPAGLAGDTVTRITPMGMTGSATAIVYGGRANGVDIHGLPMSARQPGGNCSCVARQGVSSGPRCREPRASSVSSSIPTIGNRSTFCAGSSAILPAIKFTSAAMPVPRLPTSPRT